MAAPGSDDERVFGYGAMAEHQAGQSPGTAEASEGRSGRTIAGLAAPVLPAPTCVHDELYSDLSEFMNALPFSRLTPMEEHEDDGV